MPFVIFQIQANLKQFKIVLLYTECSKKDVASLQTSMKDLCTSLGIKLEKDEDKTIIESIKILGKEIVDTLKQGDVTIKNLLIVEFSRCSMSMSHIGPRTIKSQWKEAETFGKFDVFNFVLFRGRFIFREKFKCFFLCETCYFKNFTIAKNWIRGPI
jgi:hypothetical protein